jgi:hypothetical protein
MSIPEIIEDFPELTETDIRACLEFAADREHRFNPVATLVRSGQEAIGELSENPNFHCLELY